MLPAGPAGLELRELDARCCRVTLQRGGGSVRRTSVDLVVELPETPLVSSAARRLRDLAGLWVQAVDRHVLVDDADPSVVLLQELQQHWLNLTAERAVEVRELDHGDRGGG